MKDRWWVIPPILLDNAFDCSFLSKPLGMTFSHVIVIANSADCCTEWTLRKTNLLQKSGCFSLVSYVVGSRISGLPSFHRWTSNMPLLILSKLWLGTMIVTTLSSARLIGKRGTHALMNILSWTPCQRQASHWYRYKLVKNMTRDYILSPSCSAGMFDLPMDVRRLARRYVLIMTNEKLIHHVFICSLKENAWTSRYNHFGKKLQLHPNPDASGSDHFMFVQLGTQVRIEWRFG